MKPHPHIALGATLLVASLASIATSASAAPVDISSGSAGFFHTPGAGTFTDTYTFSLSSNQTVNVMLSSVVGGSQNLDFTSIVLASANGTTSFAAHLLSNDPFESWIIDSALLTPGGYTLTAIGNNSAAIASYAGVIALGGSSATAPASGSGPLDFSTGSTGFASTPGAGAFTDTYSFTLATAQAVNLLISSVVGGSQDVNISGITISGPSGTYSAQELIDGTFDNWALNTPVLNPGNYVVTTRGTNSPAVGSYAGSIAIGASGLTPPTNPDPNTVPEPGSWALLLTGLGAAYATLRRRKAGNAPAGQPWTCKTPA